MKKLLNKKVFTLIELIVVIAILAILALILIPSLLNYINEANRSKDESNARSLYSQVALDVATKTDAALNDKYGEGSVTEGVGSFSASFGDVTCTVGIEDKVITSYDCGTVATDWFEPGTPE